MTDAVWFLLGLAFGSFANLAAARLPYGENIFRGRSRCPGCAATIRAVPDLLPVVSWFALAGRCRACGARISVQYPLVEVVMGFLFVLAHRAGGDPVRAAWLAFWLGYLFVVAVIDLRTRLILDAMTYPGVVLAVAGNLLLFDMPLSSLSRSPFFGAWVGAGLLYLVRAAGGKFFGEEAMGLGDVKLMAVAGGLLGAEGVVSAFFLGSIAGGVVSVVLLLARRVGRRTPIPYGPFLALGTAIVLVLGERAVVFPFPS